MQNIQEMVGFYPGRFWVICWKYITPALISVSHSDVLAQVVDLRHLRQID